MIAVIFEVVPAEGRCGEYLDHAARLRPLLQQLDGFVSVERFQSLGQAGKLVSLSFWRDEDAVRRWREQPQHRMTQAAGRAGIFTNYRLRVAQVARDYGLYERGQAPAGHEPRPQACPLVPGGVW